jgi:protein O-mannosyl-transferase
MSKKQKQKPQQLRQPSVAHNTTEIKQHNTKTLNKGNYKTVFWKQYLGLAIALILAYAVFSPTQKYDFVNWDDDKFCYENQLLTSMNEQNFWQNSKLMFKRDFLGAYAPLTIFTLGLDHKYGGKEPYTGISNPGSWHRTNIWLHLLTIIFAYLIALELGLNNIAATFLAILFAAHPMRVESVAWITERKDVLYGSLYLMAIFCYIKFKKNRSYIGIVLSFVFFGLSLLSKIQAVALPLSLIAIDYYLDKKFVWSSVWKKTPYFLLSLAIGAYGVSVLSETNTLDQASTNFSMFQRLFIGSYSYLVYLIKLVVPYILSPLYPYPGVFPSYFYPTMLITPVVFYALYWGYKKGHYALVFSIAFFSFNIFFLLQILGAGQGFIADRYTYIAYFGLFFGLAYLLQKSTENEKYQKIAIGLASIYLIAQVSIAFKQVKIWENSGTMWTHVLKYYNQATTPYGNRANYYRSQKMWDLALADYASSIALQDSPGARNSRGKLFFDRGIKNPDSVRMALAEFNKAIELNPNDGEYYSNRGAANAILGNDIDALNDLTKSIKLKPENSAVYLNRSLTYNKLGNFKGAIGDLNTYLTLNPNHTDIYYEIGRLHTNLKEFPLAIKNYDIAISREQKDFYYFERGMAHLNSGNKPKAKTDFEIARKLGNKNVTDQFMDTVF